MANTQIAESMRRVCDLGQESVVQIQKLYWRHHISTQMGRPENGLPDRREHCSVGCAW